MLICWRPVPPRGAGQFLESMSISTKRGDDGFTDLMYGRRVSKIDKRVVAIIDAKILAGENVDLIRHIRQSSPQTGILILAGEEEVSRAVISKDLPKGVFLLQPGETIRIEVGGKLIWWSRGRGGSSPLFRRRQGWE